jgi:DNA-directed RNA polymerase specialized sigma24 family protein
VADPGGELETLWPRDNNAVGGPRRSPLPRRARGTLFVGLVVVAIATVVQLLALAWFELLGFLFRGSAEVLVHTGGLDRRTFAACSIAALVLDAVLLAAVATRSIRRTLRRPVPAPDGERFAVRHPFAAASAGLLLALAFVIAAGWRPSPYFPYPLATVVVLATAYWFGLLGVLAMARAADLTWRAVRAWGVAAQWRTGFLLASLVLTGAAGYGLIAIRWYAGPLHAVEAGLALPSPGHAGGLLARELDGLCLIADKLDPSLAHSSAAPACEFLTTDTWQLDDCVAGLTRDWVPGAKQRLRRRGFGPYDIDDAVMKALLATCTREPPPGVRHAYFFAMAENQATQTAAAARRACDAAHALVTTCAAGEPPESRAAKLARLWDDALCQVSDDAAQILRRRLEQDESFREIADHLGISEADARETYHHAIKQLRTSAVAGCDDLRY